MEKVTYKISKQLIDAFTKEALKNRNKSGHNETLALIAGVWQEGELIAKDLIFPKQNGTSSDVEDLGK